MTELGNGVLQAGEDVNERSLPGLIAASAWRACGVGLRALGKAVGDPPNLVPP
jgi:hypothetical protein